jgi:phosphomannomutase / phosphoglucomutase
MRSEKLTKQLFGTNGARGVAGKDMVPPLVFRIGAAFGSMRQGRIAVGRDTRTSGDPLLYAMKAGLRATGCDIVDCGVLPTPALQYIVKDHFDGGVMITASHNPPEYNGVKIIESDGTEMADDETVELEERLFNNDFNLQPWNNVGREASSPDLVDRYVMAVVRQFPAEIGKGMLVAVDPGSGPACTTTPEILKMLGCRVLTVNGNADGRFPGRMPEPTPDGLSALSALVISSGASFGVAHDGDADRAVFVDEKGEFVEENQEFALIVQHLCRQQKGIIVTPVSTSQLVEAIALQEGCSVTYTRVGSIYVARTMHSLVKEGKYVMFGGEGNGGLIFPGHQFCRDGGMTAATMVSVLTSGDAKLSDLVSRLPRRYMIKDKVRSTRAEKVIETLGRSFRHDVIEHTDGIKISRGSTWALIRASGTEPLVRILVESDDKASVELFYHELMDTLSKNLP